MRLIHLADGVSPLAATETDGGAAATWSRWQNSTCPGCRERTGRKAREPFTKTHASTLCVKWKPCISKERTARETDIYFSLLIVKYRLFLKGLYKVNGDQNVLSCACSKNHQNWSCKVFTGVHWAYRHVLTPAQAFQQGLHSVMILWAYLQQKQHLLIDGKQYVVFPDTFHSAPTEQPVPGNLRAAPPDELLLRDQRASESYGTAAARQGRAGRGGLIPGTKQTGCW